MSQRLRVLLVEDSPVDAELLLRELRRSGFDPIWQRVDSEQEYIDSLSPDIQIILSDYSMPEFDGVRALKLMQQRALEIPFIIISGTIGEAVAVEAMRAGANDYLMKGHLARLGPTIARELQEAQDRVGRRRAEAELRRSEDRYRDLVEHSDDLIWTHDLDGRIFSINRAASELLGYNQLTLLSMRIQPTLFSGIENEFDSYIAALRKTGNAKGAMAVTTSTGQKRVWEYSNSLRTEGVEVPIVRGMAHDVTEIRRAEEALGESEERYRQLFASNPLPMWVYDLATLGFLEVNDAAVYHYGYSREEFLAMTIRDIRPPEDVPALLASMSNPDSGLNNAGIWRHLRKDGQIIDAEITSHELIFAGRPADLVLAYDITERKRAAEAVKQAEEKYRSIFENAVEGIFQSTPDGRFVSVNPSLVRILGYESPEELMANRSNIASQHYVDPDVRAELETILAEHGVVVGYECEVYRKDRSKIWTAENVRVVRGEDGVTLYFEGSVEDIAERKTLEEQLRQSQKLEAIGMLAGGIAHDFNNLLTVISGYSELTLKRLREDDPNHRNISEVKTAAARAAGLTRQLLAFSRKQVLQPKVLDLNAVVSELETLLQRLIGEDISLRTVLDTDLGTVKADPGQIEQIIMNLAVNARDAMPRGGKLTIETRNVHLDDAYAKKHIAVIPGPYVMVATSDTGMGMDQQTQSRIFEPFFTTKEAGKGTGLGLSTVYGIVKQSGGNIWVYSEVGLGTTFKVYLPRVDEGTTEYHDSETIEGDLQGAETILLAEDEEMVRKLARQVLEMYGYQVLEAANGSEALLICESHAAQIHLLITDVIMPEMSGRELADRVAELRPEMKSLYMSGYTDDAIIHHGVLEEGTNFIQKPFPTDALVRKVREIMDAAKKPL